MERLVTRKHNRAAELEVVERRSRKWLKGLGIAAGSLVGLGLLGYGVKVWKNDHAAHRKADEIRAKIQTRLFEGRADETIRLYVIHTDNPDAEKSIAPELYPGTSRRRGAELPKSTTVQSVIDRYNKWLHAKGENSQVQDWWTGVWPGFTVDGRAADSNIGFDQSILQGHFTESTMNFNWVRNKDTVAVEVEFTPETRDRVEIWPYRYVVVQQKDIGPYDQDAENVYAELSVPKGSRLTQATPGQIRNAYNKSYPDRSGDEMLVVAQLTTGENRVIKTEISIPGFKDVIEAAQKVYVYFGTKEWLKSSESIVALGVV